MDKLSILGNGPLEGRIPISGAKNSALKLQAASLLCEEPLVLTSMPNLADTRFMADLDLWVVAPLLRLVGDADTLCRAAGREAEASGRKEEYDDLLASFTTTIRDLFSACYNHRLDRKSVV